MMRGYEKRTQMKMLMKENDLLLNIDSKILHEMNHRLLSVMLLQTDERIQGKSFKMIHDFSKGISAQQFDASVKGKGPTLIIIQAGEYVFGAYVVDIWASGGGWIKGTKDNFLFTFGKDSTPVKLYSNGNSNDIHLSSCGCHLGQNGDLNAFCGNCCSVPTSFTVFAEGYEGTLSNTLIAGSPQFTITNCEVFHITD